MMLVACYVGFVMGNKKKKYQNWTKIENFNLKSKKYPFGSSFIPQKHIIIKGEDLVLPGMKSDITLLINHLYVCINHFYTSDIRSLAT